MKKIPIKKGQTWVHIVSGDRILVYRKSDKGWRIIRISKELTGKSSHNVTNQTLWTKFNLIS